VLSLELHTEDATGPGLPQVRIRVGNGDGVVLEGDGRPFHDAVVQAARPNEVDAWLDRIRPERAALDVRVAGARARCSSSGSTPAASAAVLQPRPDADELSGRPCPRREHLLVRSARPDRPRHDLNQGEALVAGKIAPHPALIRFGARLTHEGGADGRGLVGRIDVLRFGYADLNRS
jgi:hypothetical protein